MRGLRSGLASLAVYSVLVFLVSACGSSAPQAKPSSPAAATSRASSFTLPGTLLGRNENTSPAARALDLKLRRAISAGAHSKVAGMAASVYGSQSGVGFVVAGGGVCGSCAFRSFNVAIGALGASGVAGRTYDPGPDGGTLLCAQRSAQGPAFECWWWDTTTGGLVLYSRGSASSLADAAAKTRQVRAAVEH